MIGTGWKGKGCSTEEESVPVRMSHTFTYYSACTQISTFACQYLTPFLLLIHRHGTLLSPSSTGFGNSFTHGDQDEVTIHSGSIVVIGRLERMIPEDEQCKLLAPVKKQTMRCSSHGPQTGYGPSCRLFLSSAGSQDVLLSLTSRVYLRVSIMSAN